MTQATAWRLNLCSSIPQGFPRFSRGGDDGDNNKGNSVHAGKMPRNVQLERAANRKENHAAPTGKN
jgi:hypothetical protein